MRTALLAPLLIAQAVWVVARAARLPEAAGPRAGQSGQGVGLRLLVVGDSSAAGVGVVTQDDALVGQLSADLARDHAVAWHLVARSGVTVAGALQMVTQMPDMKFDAVLICVGVNDVKNGMRRAVWRQRYAKLLNVLRGRFGATRIVVSGVPPMAEFPLLPRPLNTVLGARATMFDEDLKALAREGGAVHLPFESAHDQSEMATDGFHPGPAIYAAWAARAARVIRQL